MGSALDPRIEHARARILSALSERISIPKIAATVHLSWSHFSHLFSRDLGASPQRFIKAQRMCLAQDLLKVKQLSVKEIAFQVGFRDPSRFTREFKRMYLVTPSQYRKMATTLKDSY
jgi:AraC-like DNA-binding protein